MMICTLSSGDKSHSIGFHRAPASWDFTGPGAQRLLGSQHGGTGRWRGIGGVGVTPARRGEKIPIITGKCQAQVVEGGSERRCQGLSAFPFSFCPDLIQGKKICSSQRVICCRSGVEENIEPSTLSI